MVFFGIYGGMLAGVIGRRLLALLSAIVAWGVDVVHRPARLVPVQ
ncbi:hypothetical protein GCM10027415_05450 [Humibacter ginsengisoli]